MPSNLPPAPNAHSAAKITTEEFASRVLVVPQTIRAGLCRNGHYLGLKPLKLSGRLLWDSAAVNRLLAEDITQKLSEEALFRSGNHVGLRPVKLPNRRLLLDSEKLQCISAEGEVK